LQPTLFLGQNSLKVSYYLKSAAIFYPNWDQTYADRLMKEFKLEPKKKIFQLSKGQMSMVTILIALASRAPITILDEPAAGLDVVARERFYQLLLEDFAQTERTFLVSTHIIEEAASVFERVIILDEGHILENAQTEELVSQFHYVSGGEDVVDEVCRGLEVLSTHRMGRRKTVAVRGGGVKLDAAQSADVDVSPMNLQNVFVALCGHGDAQ
jgi:ABC-2 type transport system ATP-binding protein